MKDDGYWLKGRQGAVLSGRTIGLAHLGIHGSALTRGPGVFRWPLRPHHRDRADSLRGDLGRDAAEPRAQHRVLARADDEMVDLVGLDEFENGGGGVDGLQHMHREPTIVE